MGLKEWATVCQREEWFYKVIANNRFDPSERQAKVRCFSRAASQIAKGVPPERTGIPGLGLRPAWVDDPGWALEAGDSGSSEAPL